MKEKKEKFEMAEGKNVLFWRTLYFDWGNEEAIIE